MNTKELEQQVKITGELATAVKSVIDWAEEIEKQPDCPDQQVSEQYRAIIRAIDALNTQCVTLYHIVASNLRKQTETS